MQPSGLATLDYYVAAMVLGGVGDAVGYRNQKWEYCKSGVTIHKELEELGGLHEIIVKKPDWPVSDDTVMHLATAEGLCSVHHSKGEEFSNIARKYKECMNDMEGRKPGPTSIKGCDQLRPDQPDGFRIPFNPTGTGCGAAMRAMCIGLRFPRASERPRLVEMAVECGRMTHHHPIGFLGSVASALFLSLAIQRQPVKSWGKTLLETVELARCYVAKTGVCVEENMREWNVFVDRWKEYLSQRQIADGESDPVFPAEYGVETRDKIYENFSLDGWAGRSGHDAPMIALDALMEAGCNWSDLCSRAMFHGGDSDSTGVIAAACYGAMYGFDESVPKNNYEFLEYRERLENAARNLHKSAFG